MKFLSLIPAVVFLLIFSSAAQANETILLKNGEKVEGSIVLEEEDQVLMDVNVSPSIIERKTYLREEIAEIQRPSPDELHYQPIANLKTGENSSTLATYDRVLNEILNPFLLKYPDSPLRPKVEKVRDEFFEERERVAAGEVKLDGRWLDAEEVEKRRSEIDARVAFNTMRDAAARADNIAVMNAFDVIEKNHKGQLIYPDAVALAQNALRALSREVPRLIEEHGIEFEAWKLGVERTRETRRQPLIDARAQEEASYDTRIARATASGQRWPPLISRSIKSLDAIRLLTDTENTRLQAINVEKLRSSAEKVRQAQKAIDDKDFDGAAALAGEAIALWPENAVAKTLEAGLPAIRTAHEEALKAAVEAEEAAAAEAAAEEQIDEQEATEAKEKAAAETQAPAAPPAPAEEAKPFFMTIQGAIAIVAGVLVLVTISALVNKSRSAKSAPDNEV